MIANYHTHTRWCRHACGEAEDYIVEAIRQGFKIIAITDHVPQSNDCLENRMLFSEFNDFNRLLDKTIDEYHDQIVIYKGFECEYFPEEMNQYRLYREQYGYKIMILGQHRCGLNHRINCYSQMSALDVGVYVDTVCEAIRTGFFTFLAHPDVFLCGYGKWDAVSEHALEQIFETCREHKMPIEINGNGYRKKRPYPSDKMIDLAMKYELKIILSSDAHSPLELYDEKMRTLEKELIAKHIPLVRVLDFDMDRIRMRNNDGA